MNYMEQIAQLLGVELYEEFNIDLHGTERKYRFTEQDFEYFNEPLDQWTACTYLYSILKGTFKIVKIPKPILDDVEKEYLRHIIQPFRDSVKCITKYGSTDFESITIAYYDQAHNGDEYYIHFPYFKAGTMYKGMEHGKHYTLDELGL